MQNFEDSFKLFDKAGKLVATGIINDLLWNEAKCKMSYDDDNEYVLPWVSGNWIKTIPASESGYCVFENGSTFDGTWKDLNRYSGDAKFKFSLPVEEP